MTRLQQVLLECETDYYGRPYHVSGNALFRALAQHVPAATRETLAVSHGVFVPGGHGDYPPAHTQAGGTPYLGTRLHPVETYADLFLFRDAAQRWLSVSRPRDALNTHDARSHGGRIAFAPTVRFGRPAAARTTKETTTWFCHCYLHDATGGDAVPLAEEAFETLQLGGGRNYGLGEMTLKDTQTVDLDALSFAAIEEVDAVTLELISPYVIGSEVPTADDQSVPWWWQTAGPLRRRTERFSTGDGTYTLETIDHGQVVGYTGDDPVATAKNGIRRVGTHSRYGFGELRVRPATADRVPERARVTAGGDASWS